MSFNGTIPDLILSGDSKNFKNWQATYLAPTTCQECRENHGKIFPFDVVVSDYIPVHENGTKQIWIMTAVLETRNVCYTLMTA